MCARLRGGGEIFCRSHPPAAINIFYFCFWCSVPLGLKLTVNNACRVLKIAVALSVKDLRKRTLSFIDSKLNRDTCVTFLCEASALNPGLDNVKVLAQEMVVEHLHSFSAEDVAPLPPRLFLESLHTRFRQEHRDYHEIRMQAFGGELNRTLTLKIEPGDIYDDEGKDNAPADPPPPTLPHNILCRRTLARKLATLSMDYLREKGIERIASILLLRFCECMLADPPPEVALFCLLELGGRSGQPREDGVRNDSLQLIEEKDRRESLLDRAISLVAASFGSSYLLSKPSQASSRLPPALLTRLLGCKLQMLEQECRSVHITNLHRLA